MGIEATAFAQFHFAFCFLLLIVMELRSSNATKYDGEDRRSGTNVKTAPSTKSESGTSSGARNQVNVSASSPSGRRASSPNKRQIEAKSSSSSSSCSNNEHCSTNKMPLSQHAGGSSHDSTNGQVMGAHGNSPPASSASSARVRQRDVVLYVFIYLCLNKQSVAVSLKTDRTTAQQTAQSASGRPLLDHADDRTATLQTRCVACCMS